MNHDQFAHALLEQRTRCVPQGHRIQPPIGAPDVKSGGLARLDFIEDAVIDMPQGRIDDFGEPIAVFTHDVHAGLDSGRLRRGQ